MQWKCSLKLKKNINNFSVTEGSERLIIETEKDLKVIKYFLNAMLTANNDVWAIHPGIDKQIDVIEGERAM